MDPLNSADLTAGGAVLANPVEKNKCDGSGWIRKNKFLLPKFYIQTSFNSNYEAIF